MSLRVLESGLHTLIVDAGRPHNRSLGVPLGGAADRFSWMLGNALVGNPLDAAALEICVLGPTLKATCELGISVVGAAFEMFRNGEPLSSNRSIQLHQGNELRIAGSKSGARAYLCVRGGFQEPLILGSQSSFEPVKRGQELLASPSTVTERGILWPPNADDGPIRFRAIPGPQAEWFHLERFFGPTFSVSPTSNRMGLRLSGDPLPRPERELVSEPVAPGAVQVVNDGQCIVLGVDGQTIGGYPKVAHIIAADLDRLGQLRPGDEIAFELASMDEAEAAWRERQRELQAWLTRLSV
jgi:5-oxoprolinase (ATP-hydrolysing) subunit C